MWVLVTAAQLLTCQSQPTPAAPPDSGEYRIGAGDMLSISIYKEPDASVPEVVVRSDGKVSLPLLKDVEIAGLTPAAAEKLLAEKLARYIHEPDVTVVVRQIHSRRVYVIGAVKAVGPIDLKGDMTVLQALAQAGGLTDFAKKKHIYVLRTENRKQVRIPFNYETAIKGGDVDQNVLLRPNDTVVVPQ